MAAVSVGPVKAMILSLDVAELQRWLHEALLTAEGNVRPQLKRYAEEHGIEI
jgi:phosphotransferase system enzyme I (PtsP)